jgi:hypothetical protein
LGIALVALVLLLASILVRAKAKDLQQGFRAGDLVTVQLRRGKSRDDTVQVKASRSKLLFYGRCSKVWAVEPFGKQDILWGIPPSF